MNITKLKTLNETLKSTLDGDLTFSDLHLALARAAAGESSAWKEALCKLSFIAYRVADETLEHHNALYSIFVEGNGKLPFLAFSSLPIVTCPGAGDCVEFCYSLKAWRYPAAYARQFQNTLLLSSERGRQIILDALDDQLARRKYAKRERVDFRLYVDGDFDSVKTLHYWMEAVEARPKLAAYGYSKSFYEFLAHDVAYRQQWPSNYVLNVSSGHAHSSEMEAEILKLPITRGRFNAVSIPKTKNQSKSAHDQALRLAYGKKAFTCPGKCGDCTPKGHACGSTRFDGLDIIIAVH